MQTPTAIVRLALLGAVTLALAAAGNPAQGPIRLNLNENPMGPSPLALKAIEAETKNLFRYVSDEADALTKQIAAHEGVPAEQIVLGDLLEHLGLQLALEGGPGSEFIYSVPGYLALIDSAAHVGGVGAPVPLNAQGENDLPALLAKIGPKTRSVFLINPHNPTGTVNQSAAFKSFVREASRHALVIVDEAYLEFSDDFAGQTVVDLVRGGENVLIYRTFSKAYGLGAMPLGYAIAPAPLAAMLRKAGFGNPHTLNRLALVGASASLRDTEFLARVHAAMAAERAKWKALCDELGLKETVSQANFVFIDAKRPTNEVAKAMLAEGVVVARAFPPYDTWVRITIGLPAENDQARAALRKVLATKP